MIRFLKSISFAFQGLSTAWKEQSNFRFHVVAMLVVMALGVLCEISFLEWLAIAIVCSMVLTAELLNSAIEKTVDLISPTFHPLAKQAKDIAAAAVLLTAAGSVVVGLIIFGSRFLQFLSDYL